MLLTTGNNFGLSLLLVTFVALSGCSRKVDDAQIARGVQSQIQNDTAISGQVTVRSANGVVTLNGQVPSDAASALAEREAADTPGVKQVINNLIVTPSAAMTPAPAQEPAPREKPAPGEPARRPARERHTDRPERQQSAGATTPPAAAQSEQAQAPAAAPPAEQPPAEAPAPLPPPPAPVKYAVPAGTTLSVRLIDSLNSSRNKIGDTFRATLHSPIRIDGDVLVPAGADVQGRVADASDAGRFSGHSELRLALTQLTFRGHRYPLNTETFQRAGETRGKGTAEVVGGAAAIGAIIGAIAGGGKGAAIGGLAGAGAGGTARGVMKDKGVSLPSETVLTFKLQEPVTIVTLPGDNEPER